MRHEPIEADPLLAGFYSPADAARLLQVTTPKLRGWLNGWPNSSSGPIVDREFKGSRTISFLDLIEMCIARVAAAYEISVDVVLAAIKFEITTAS